jgi:hypothetical protein
MSPKENLKSILWKAFIGIVVVILVYVVLGFVVNATSIRIYDQFPSEISVSTNNPVQQLSFSINNNAPMTLPFIDPFYDVGITMTGAENDTYCYFMNGNIVRNFTEYSLDLGKIDSGSSSDVEFWIHLGQHNVTFNIIVYYSFFITFQVSSAKYLVAYTGNQTQYQWTYSISKV